MSSELGLVLVESLAALAFEPTSRFIWLYSCLCPIQSIRGFTIILSPKVLVALDTLLCDDPSAEDQRKTSFRV